MRTGWTFEWARSIACANQKGGVGKTTTVVSLASYLALAGMRVLVVDVDPQGNATSGLGVDRNGLGATTYDLVAGARPGAELARPTSIEGLWLIPADRGLAGVEVELVPLSAREHRLEQNLRPIAGSFDYILLDCPPSLGLISVNALTAADSVLIPIQCEYYALEGLTQLMSTIDLVRDNLNPRLRVKGIVLTMFDARTTLSADVVREARRHFDSLVFDAVVPRSVRLAEAPGYGRPIALYSPESRGAHAYRSLAAQMLERDGHNVPDHPAPVWATAS